MDWFKRFGKNNSIGINTIAETNTSINSQSKPMVTDWSWMPEPSGKAVPKNIVAAISTVDIKP